MAKLSKTTVPKHWQEQPERMPLLALSISGYWNYAKLFDVTFWIDCSIEISVLCWTNLYLFIAILGRLTRNLPGIWTSQILRRPHSIFIIPVRICHRFLVGQTQRQKILQSCWVCPYQGLLVTVCWWEGINIWKNLRGTNYLRIDFAWGA